MMQEWTDYCRKLDDGVKELGKLSPETLKGYVALSNAGRGADILGAKTVMTVINGEVVYDGER